MGNFILGFWVYRILYFYDFFDFDIIFYGVFLHFGGMLL